RMSRSPRRPCPSEGRIRPASDSRKDVLPLPAGPRTIAIAPVGTSRSISLKTLPCLPDIDHPLSETAVSSMSSCSVRVSVVLSIAMAPNRLYPRRLGAYRALVRPPMCMQTTPPRRRGGLGRVDTLDVTHE